MSKARSYSRPPWVWRTVLRVSKRSATGALRGSSSNCSRVRPSGSCAVRSTWLALSVRRLPSSMRRPSRALPRFLRAALWSR
ncbi:Uncharacterised protein [Bordetella pertussis]|nr:Uncharacterised protein [Bordetella pertussis]